MLTFPSEQEHRVDIPSQPTPPTPPIAGPVGSQVTPLLSENLSPACPMDPLCPRTRAWFSLARPAPPEQVKAPHHCFVGREALGANFLPAHGCPVSHLESRVPAGSGGLLPPNPAPPASPPHLLVLPTCLSSPPASPPHLAVLPTCQSSHLCCSEVGGGGLMSTLTSPMSPQPLTSLLK